MRRDLKFPGADGSARCAGHRDPLECGGVEVLQRVLVIGQHRLASDVVASLTGVEELCVTVMGRPVCALRIPVSCQPPRTCADQALRPAKSGSWYTQSR